jgi:hypothetical protein
MTWSAVVVGAVKVTSSVVKMQEEKEKQRSLDARTRYEEVKDKRQAREEEMGGRRQDAPGVFAANRNQGRR